MKPAPRTDEELIEWINKILRHEQGREMHGEIRIQMKAGQIVSCKVEACHLPPKRT